MKRGRIRLQEEASRPGGPFSEREIGLLREVMSVLREMGVVAWLDQSTLLGLTREGRLLPWDRGVDLGAWQDQVEDCEPELAARMTRRLAGRAAVGWGSRTIRIDPIAPKRHLPVKIALYQREGGRAVKWLERPPAGMPLHRRMVRRAAARLAGPARVLPGSWLMGLAAGPEDGSPFPRRAAQKVVRAILELRDRGRDSIAAPIRTSVSANYFDKLHPVLLGDVWVLAPVDAERYLKLKYGPDWRTPRRVWKYWEQDGAIVES